ncbi:MAG: thiopeptide-type bacteriocin biosynthesis protein [Saprospirales bacterium]|nr:thiopeptide-type bacteriocin biosynthesis protein [Saprospirales bacterium]MBK8922094.1 thiopeptide-type bacteriocin biosynthesis protein [Saprospirales bacterium]
MQTWLSFHFYPLETPDVFLARGVRPFLEQYIWPTKNARAFFIRYADERGPHIRLRLRGEPDWLEQLIRPALEAWMAERGEVEEVPYVPETGRFGGPGALEWAEEYFHLSTRVVLERLNRPFTYGDALFDALRLHVITAFASGWNREKSAWYFDQLCTQWMELFFQPAPAAAESGANWQATLREDFEKSFDPQREELRLVVTELWAALEKEKFDAGQPEWLRWLRGNQMILPEFGEALEKSLPSLLHLTNNRLGVNNQDEVYLNYLLSRVIGRTQH